MQYAIMRMKKIKSRASLVGLLKHNTREVMPKNADPARLDENAYTATTAEALSRYSSKLPEKVRKNAVHAVEVVLTASPDWFAKASKKEVKEFIDRSRAWLYDKFGRENELLLASHYDEKTIHFHADFIPLVDGKLNAKKLIGGSSYRMRELQDEFYARVGEPLGMERGEKQTRRKHTDPKDLNRLIKEVETERKAWNKELFKAMNEDFKGVFQKHGISAEDTHLFWKSVFDTFSRFKAIKKENEKTEVQENEVKKSRSR